MNYFDRKEAMRKGAKGAAPYSAPVLVRRQFKQDVSMWDLLIWAYRRQLVHYGAGLDDLSGGHQSTTNIVGQVAALGVRVDTSRNVKSVGAYAHEDAFAVHEKVGELRPRQRARLIKAAAAATLPKWSGFLPESKVCGVFKKNGHPRMQYGSDYGDADAYGTPNACRIQIVGYTLEEREAYRQALRDEYWRFRKQVHRFALYFYANDRLKRYRVTSVGIKKDPWLRKSEI